MVINQSLARLHLTKIKFDQKMPFFYETRQINATQTERLSSSLVSFLLGDVRRALLYRVSSDTVIAS